MLWYHFDRLQRGNSENLMAFVVWSVIMFIMVNGIETANYEIISNRLKDNAVYKAHIQQWSQTIESKCPDTDFSSAFDAKSEI